MSSIMKPPDTLVVGRGELDDDGDLGGHTLLWLWPGKGPVAPAARSTYREGGMLRALELQAGQTLTIQRGVAEVPRLVPDSAGWQITVPSDATFADVSRTPTRVSHRRDGLLSLDTEAVGQQRFWVNLNPVDGPCGDVVLPPWAAVAIGPIILWHLPFGLTAAHPFLTPADPDLTEKAAGFRHFSRATSAVIDNLRRRVQMHLLVPRSATVGRWEAGQPFILTGEPGCGKTTLAKAVYSPELGTRGFAVVHPVAVEQEVDLVALTGSASFAHDGVKVPDQEGHLEVVTHPDGVILIDEVHTLDSRLKKHLIDLLTEWTFRPRGDTTRRKKVRGLIVFATNQLDVVRDPRRFPGDLFARMGGEAGIIEVPPLRRRRWEVPYLAEALLLDLQPPLPFSPNAVRKLLLHCWPQNHWELENAVQEAHSLAAANGDAEILPEYLKLKPPPGSLKSAPEVDMTGETVQDMAAVVIPPRQRETWRFPEAVGWADLFAALGRFRSFPRLRDAWQAQLGVKNNASVNRRIGRAIRCGGCDLSSCTRCFLGQLAQSSAGDVVDRLEQLSAEETPRETARWIVTVLRELLVERLEVFRNDDARAALAAAAAALDQESIAALVARLQEQL